jgi:hypothetical protein
MMLNTLNSRVFLLQSNHTSRFQVGRIVDNKFELGKIKCHNEQIGSLSYTKFEGQTLVGLSGRNIGISGFETVFVELNLITQLEVVTELQPANPEADDKSHLVSFLQYLT